jgi:hypothetical protein
MPCRQRLSFGGRSSALIQLLGESGDASNRQPVATAGLLIELAIPRVADQKIVVVAQIEPIPTDGVQNILAGSVAKPPSVYPPSG